MIKATKIENPQTKSSYFSVLNLPRCLMIWVLLYTTAIIVKNEMNKNKAKDKANFPTNNDDILSPSF